MQQRTQAYHQTSKTRKTRSRTKRTRRRRQQKQEEQEKKTPCKTTTETKEEKPLKRKEENRSKAEVVDEFSDSDGLDDWAHQASSKRAKQKLERKAERGKGKGRA